MTDFIIETKLYRFGLYFVTLIGSLAVILFKITECLMEGKTKVKGGKKALIVLPLLAGIALYQSWKNIFGFIFEDAAAFDDLASWIKGSEVIVKAYKLVTDTPVGFLWSSHLLLFVLPYVVFINTSARKMNMSFIELCSYIWLGFGGAISVSYALFLWRLYLVSGVKTKHHQELTVTGNVCLSVCLVTAVYCIVMLSFAESTFGVYLLVLHVVLFLPVFFPSQRMTAKGFQFLHVKLAPYFISGVCAFCVYIYTTYIVLTDASWTGVMSVVNKGFAHYCQAGISWDCISCFLIFLKHGYFECTLREWNLLKYLITCFLLCKLLSMGATFSLFAVYVYLIDLKQIKTQLKKE